MSKEILRHHVQEEAKKYGEECPPNDFLPLCFRRSTTYSYHVNFSSLL
jgi:hypothetical protein